MIDIKLLRNQPELVKKWCDDKFVKVDVDAMIELDQRVRQFKQQIDDLNAQRNIAAANRDIEKGKEIKARISEIESHYKQLEEELYIAMKQLPNGYSEDTPYGKDDSENVVIKTWGKAREFNFEPKDQEDLLVGLGCFDKERAVKISGSRFVYLFGDIVLSQQAIISWTYATLTNQDIINQIIKDWKLEGVSNKPFTPALPPIIMKREMMDRMGRYNPNDTTYELKMDDMVLIASAEHSIGPIFADEMLKEAELPIRYLGFSPAFRREAGSYGKDMKGTFRLHQFDKLELETFTTPEQGLQEQHFLVAIQEYLMQQLGLHYELMICCTGDMGSPDYRHVDLNTRLPSQKKYRETHSADYMTDFQSRRLNTRVKLSTGENVFVHMNDATAFAMSRTLVAICENYQNEDGTITVPEVLRPYMGGKSIIG